VPDEGEYQDPLALPYALSIERFCPKMQPLDEDPEVGPSRNTFHLFQIACKNGAFYPRAMLSSSTHARDNCLEGIYGRKQEVLPLAPRARGCSNRECGHS
jgi:hypothetical protein